VGAGNYAKAVLLPALANLTNVRRVSLVTATGPSASRTAERFGFERCGTDPEDAVNRDDVDLVFIATRHRLHAQQATAALRAGKAVWLEKPLGLTREEVRQVCEAAGDSPLMVGYNRRFSSHARAIRETFETRTEPMGIEYSVAAGTTPRNTWITDPEEGGGRIIGEVCHFIDLCTYLVQREPVRVYAQALGRDPETDDSIQALITYADLSTASISYLARTNSQLAKERFVVSAGGKTAICDNFKSTQILGGTGVKHLNQDKGQAMAIKEFVDALRNGRGSPFKPAELLSTSEVTFAIIDSLRTNQTVRIGNSE
ncbi:MAG: Gfo/Idh/MocA family oxidoreductase, partial [Myxococcota bacterium]